jgi:hypothetical protein
LSDNIQIWRFLNPRKTVEIQDPLMASQHLAEDLGRQTGGEAQMIVHPNSADCHSVISGTSLLGDETIIGQ